MTTAPPTPAPAAGRTVGSTVLEARDVSKSFAGVHALRSVDLQLRSGEIHTLVGENGAGKSTLIKVLTGVHAPDTGELLHEGRPVEFTAPSQAQDAGISTIYQEINLVPLLTVAQNIYLEIGRAHV